jgi:hypothetical protein
MSANSTSQDYDFEFDFDPIYSYFALIPNLVSTLISAYSLVYASKNAHHVPKEIMVNWAYKFAYYTAPLSFLFSNLVYIPWCVSLFLPNASPDTQVAVLALYSLCVPALHVAIGCYCIMCLQRYLWLSNLLSFNRNFILLLLALTVFLFVGEALTLSPYSIYEYNVGDENYTLVTNFVYYLGTYKMGGAKEG